MRLTVAFLLLVLLHGTSANVVMLDDENFETTVTPNGPKWLLLFASLGCQHCRAAMQSIDVVAKMLAQEMPVGLLECKTSGVRQCDRFQINAVPQIALVSPGDRKMWNFNQPASETSLEEIVKFAREGHQASPALPLPARLGAAGPSYVVTLGDHNISLAEAGGATWLVTFFSPGCGHCRRFEPILAALSVELKDKADVKLAAVDIQQHTLSSRRYRVIGYPNIVVIKGGNYYRFDGNRNPESLKAFIADPTKAAAKPIPSPHWGVLDTLSLLLDEVQDVAGEIWRNPDVGGVILKIFLAIIVLAPIALGGMVWLANKLTEEPSGAVRAKKTN